MKERYWIVLFLLLFMVLFLALGFDCCSQKILHFLGLKLAEKFEGLKFLGVCMGGILLVAQVLFSNKRAKAMEESAKAQADANEHIERGQRQERLKNAIEHLGSVSVSVRLGGVYELFHLAEDIPELRGTVLDILCSHIRWTTSLENYQKKHTSNPSEEVQSLLTLLFVRKHNVFIGLTINLQGSWLNGAELSGARLGRAELSKARLLAADLGYANLKCSLLKSARLQKAKFHFAQLPYARLGRASLQETDLSCTNMKMTDFAEANLQGADLWKTDLQGANLREAKLRGASLAGAQLQGAFLGGACLQGAQLIGTAMQAATLSGVEMAGVHNLSVSMSFEDRIRSYIGIVADASEVIFSGGLSCEDVDSFISGLDDVHADKLREQLATHIGQNESSESSANGSAFLGGSYTQEEADIWIEDHNQAMLETV